MKILITGFDPFGGAEINPAFEAVKRLPDRLGEAQLIKLEVPTVFEKDGVVLERAIEAEKPDVVLCVGQAGGRSVISVERVAINLMEARIPDNDGQQPMDQKIKEDGENAYFTTLPVKAMVKNVKEHGIPSSISYTAGTYVCNDIMYRLLYLIDRTYPSIRGGFIHVPYLPEQVRELPDGTPSMSAELIAEGLRWALEAIISQKNEDIKEAMGTIM